MLQDLITRGAQVPLVAQAAREAFEAQGDALVVEVRRATEAFPGSTPATREALDDLCRQDLLLVTSAFRLENHEILAQTFPWAYRVSASRGVPFDFWLGHLRAWRQAVAKALPPDVAAPVAQVYDWLLAEHQEMVQLSQDLETSLFTPPRSARPAVRKRPSSRCCCTASGAPALPWPRRWCGAPRKAGASAWRCCRRRCTRSASFGNGGT